jgi:hypothetical protein
VRCRCGRVLTVPRLFGLLSARLRFSPYNQLSSFDSLLRPPAIRFRLQLHLHADCQHQWELERLSEALGVGCWQRATLSSSPACSISSKIMQIGSHRSTKDGESEYGVCVDWECLLALQSLTSILVDFSSKPALLFLSLSVRRAIPADSFRWLTDAD